MVKILDNVKSSGMQVTVLGSGSRGNAIAIHTDESVILVDAGFSAKELQRRLRVSGIDEGRLKAILISHEHIDHIRGARVLSQRLGGVPIYCNRLTGDYMRDADSRLGKLHIFTAGSSFRIGEFEVNPFSIPHDACDPVGFTIDCCGKYRVGIATDLGHVSSLVKYQLRDCDMLIVESNHDVDMVNSSERPWHLKKRIVGRHGHLSNEDCAGLLEDVIVPQTKHLVLAHASGECNRHNLILEVADALLKTIGRCDIKPYVGQQDMPLPSFRL